MKTDTDIVLGYDKDYNLVYAKTFDFDSEYGKMMKAYEYVQNNYYTYLMCSIEKLGEKIEIDTL